MHTLTKWRQFIGAKTVTTATDHPTLSRILKQRQVGSRLGYWLDKSLDSSITVVYKPGLQNVVADGISRRPDFVSIVTRKKEKEKEKEGGLEVEWDTEYEESRDSQEVWEQGGAKKGRSKRLEEGVRAILFQHREQQREANHLWVRTKRRMGGLCAGRNSAKGNTGAFPCSSVGRIPGDRQDQASGAELNPVAAHGRGYGKFRITVCPMCEGRKFSFKKWWFIATPPTSKFAMEGN